LKTKRQKEFKSIFSKSEKIVITTHTNPDGDAIGSSLALYHYIKSKGKDVKLVVPNSYPEFISWMPGNDEIIVTESSWAKAREAFSEAELIYCLDYNAIHRSGCLKEILAASEVFKIMIDHHPQPEENDFNLLYSCTDTSSTAELIYDYISWLDDSYEITPEVATCLYVGIMTDTGSFSFACNRPETFMVTAKLLETGIDGEYIHRMVYDTFSENRLRLLGFSLSQKLVVLEEFATAYISLSREDLRKFNYQVGDTEGLVNYALSIKGIQMAVLLTERKDRIRLSFRSKGNFSVNDVAREHFNGGGHRNAAGGDSYDTLQRTTDKLEKLLPDYKESLVNNKA
jgi:phosphoesterase RecJ-like protein